VYDKSQKQIVLELALKSNIYGFKFLDCNLDRQSSLGIALY